MKCQARALPRCNAMNAPVSSVKPWVTLPERFPVSGPRDRVRFQYRFLRAELVAAHDAPLPDDELAERLFQTMQND